MLSQLLAFISKHRNKMLLALLSATVFMFLYFPFSDLSTIISTAVTTSTENKAFFQFEKMHLGVFPGLGIKFEDVSFDYVDPQSPQLPTFKLAELAVYPALTSLLSPIPNGRISAQGLLNGNVEVSLADGAKSENGNPRKKIEIKAEKLNLADLKDFPQIPLLLKGQLSLDGKILADLSFSEQPDADILIQIEKLELPSQMLGPLGGLRFPDLRIGQVQIKGKLISGRFNFEEARIGRDGDEIRGDIKGGFNLNVSTQYGLRMEMGAYNLDLDISLKKSVEDKFALLLSFVSKYKIATADGSRFRVRVEGINPAYPPNIRNLQ